MQTFRTFLVVCHVIGFEVGWFFVMMISGGLVWAAENRNTLQLVVQIQPRASLSMERTQITFAGPEDQRLIPCQEGPVQLTVKVRASAVKSATLSMLAESDLETMEGLIPIQQVEWTAKGLGTSQGVLSRTHEQIVERYTTSGIRQTQLIFVLKNNGNLPKATLPLLLTSPSLFPKIQKPNLTYRRRPIAHCYDPKLITRPKTSPIKTISGTSTSVPITFAPGKFSKPAVCLFSFNIPDLLPSNSYLKFTGCRSKKDLDTAVLKW